jgi:hypothetical protein
MLLDGTIDNFRYSQMKVLKNLSKKYLARRNGIAKRICSVQSPWRPHIEDKRMVLEYTHGLFIT